MTDNNETWPPSPTPPEPHVRKLQPSKFLTKHKGLDVVVGLAVGFILHFLLFRVFEGRVPANGILVSTMRRSWWLAIATAVIVFMGLVRRYPTLMTFYAVGTVIAVFINLLSINLVETFYDLG